MCMLHSCYSVRPVILCFIFPIGSIIVSIVFIGVILCFSVVQMNNMVRKIFARPSVVFLVHAMITWDTMFFMFGFSYQFRG